MKKVLSWIWLFIVASCLYSGFSLLANADRDVTFLWGLVHTTIVGGVFIVVVLCLVGLTALTDKCIKVLKGK